MLQSQILKRYFKPEISATEFCFEVTDLNSASRTAKLPALVHSAFLTFPIPFSSLSFINIFHSLAHRSRQIAHAGFDCLRCKLYPTSATKPHKTHFCVLLRKPAFALPLFSCFLPLNLLLLVAHNAFLRVTARACFGSTTLFLLLAS